MGGENTPVEPTDVAPAPTTAAAPERREQAEKQQFDTTVLDSQLISKLRTRIGEEKGNQMRQAVLANLEEDLTKDEKELLKYGFSDNVFETAYTESVSDTDVNQLKKCDWDDEDNIEENMAELRSLCLQEFLDKLKAEKGKKSKEQEQSNLFGQLEPIDTDLDVLESHLESHLEEIKENKPDLSGLRTKLTELQSGKSDATAPLKQEDIEALKNELTKFFKDTYRPAFLSTLGEDKKDLKKTLENVDDPSEFFDKLEKSEDSAEEAESAESGKGLIGGLLDKWGLNTPEVQKYLDKIPWLGIILTLVAKFWPGLTDGLIKDLDNTDTREVFANLQTGHYMMKEHKKDDKEWTEHLTSKKKAEKWMVSLDGGTYNKGRDKDALNALLSTDMTVGELKELAKEGDKPKSLDVADLAVDLRPSFPFVERVYNEIMKDEAVKTGTQNDDDTLASYIAEKYQTEEEAPPAVAAAGQATTPLAESAASAE